MATEIITPMQIYWLTRLDHVHTVLAVTCVLLVLSTIGILVAGGIMQDCSFTEETNKRGRKFVGRTPFMAAAFVVALLVNALVPTTREMAAILIVPRIANSEKVQTVGNQLYDLAVEWMEELRPANRGSAK